MGAEGVDYAGGSGNGGNGKPGMSARAYNYASGGAGSARAGMGESYPMSNTGSGTGRSPASGSPPRTPAHIYVPPPGQSYASRPSGDGSGEEVLLGRRGDRDAYGSADGNAYENGYGNGGGYGYGYSERNSMSAGATRRRSEDVESGRVYGQAR